MKFIDITGSTYENLIHKENVLYDRVNILHDVDAAKIYLEEYLLSLSDVQLKQQLGELMYEQNYSVVYEAEKFLFAENKTNIYCFSCSAR